MDVLFTSDLHLGHKSICEYRDIFKSRKEHDDYIFYRLGELTSKHLLYIIGDFLFDHADFDEYVNTLSKFPFRMKLLMGNHDTVELYKEAKRPKNLELLQPLYRYKNYWLSHCPIHPSEIRSRTGNIHGHCHNEANIGPQYFNVCIDHHDFSFVPLDRIKEQLKIW